MSKAQRSVKRGEKFTPQADKYQSPFGPRPTLRKIVGRLMK
jgi:hypothetical protein